MSVKGVLERLGSSNRGFENVADFAVTSSLVMDPRRAASCWSRPATAIGYPAE